MDNRNNDSRNNRRTPMTAKRKPVMQKKAKPKADKRLVIAVIVIIIVAVAAVVLSIVFHNTKASADPHFNVSTDTAQAQDSAADTASADWVNDTNSLNILVLGFDKVAVLTDVMMIVNYNTANGSVTIMQIPRDTYFENINTTYYKKMNGVYRSYRNDESKSLDIDAARGMADVLEKELCINIEKCIVMDLDGFDNVVDAVGGVDMYVPQDMTYNDPGNIKINLKEGYQHLDGDKAEQLVRYREGYIRADLSRENAQKVFMSAFITKIKSSFSVDNMDKLTQLAENIVKYTTTDFTVNDIIDLAPKALKVEMSNIHMLTMPSSEYNEYDSDGNNTVACVLMSKPLMLEIINKYFNTFSNEITLDMFDKDKLFVNESSSAMLNKYKSDTATIVDGFQFSADELTGDNENVPIY